VGNAAIAVAFVSYLGYVPAFEIVNDNRIVAAQPAHRRAREPRRQRCAPP
jgi:hypothetical protein